MSRRRKTEAHAETRRRGETEGGHSCPPNGGLENPPSGWEMSPIGDLTLRTKQRNPERDPERRFFYVDVSSVSNTSFRIVAPTELPGAEAPSRARKVIQAGDVLFATVRPTLKRVALVPDDLHDQIASTGFIVLRSDALRLDSRYLYYRLLTDAFTQRMSELERGASYPAVRDSDILNEKIARPRIPEQRKIAGVLGLVQRAMEQQERLIALTAELKKALLHQLFTQGLRGGPQKQTEIGPVPQSWEVVTIGDLFKFSSGKSRPDDTELTASESRPFPVFGGNGVLGYSSRYLVEEPLLLIGRVGEYCGCAHHTAGRAWVSDNALYAKEILRETNTRYAAEYFSYANLNQYRNQAGQPLITQGVISKVRMPLPPIDQQREILEPLTLLNQKLSVSKRKHAALTVLFRTLLQQLMTAQIRVDKLDIEELNVGIS